MCTITDMKLQNQFIHDGFGERLKSERRRLKLSQEELAIIGGVRRLAQIQYENENTHPTTKYLNAVGQAGVNLWFLLFDQKTTYLIDSQIDEKVLEYINKISIKFPDGKLSADAYSLLFRLTKNIMVQIYQGELSEDYDVLSVVSKAVGK